MGRNLELSTRKEDTRSKVVPLIVHFEIEEIKQHFDESMFVVDGMFAVAQNLVGVEFAIYSLLISSSFYGA